MTRYAHTMFCDDVRHEIGGKISFMGVYSGKLISSDLPGILPKLCVAVTLHTAIENPFKKLSIKGIFRDQEVFAMELGEEEISVAESQAAKRDDASAYYVQLLAILSPFQVEEPGRLSLQILADGERIKTASLDIEIASSESE